MTALVGYLLIFVLVGFLFLFGGLLTGRLLRPARPGPEKATVYECGEPAVGSSWVQFDLRFYVVALLFVVFDVEMAFFFPWAVVFGSANRAAAGEAVAGFPDPEAAGRLAWLAFADIVVFFGLLVVGFIYLWKRGDLEWVRSTAAQQQEVPTSPLLLPAEPAANGAAAAHREPELQTRS
ncbi:MAG TPA: NADH-quinone oxidoreductase subunit A [Gemmataceae bacterium]